MRISVNHNACNEKKETWILQSLLLWEFRVAEYDWPSLEQGRGMQRRGGSGLGFNSRRHSGLAYGNHRQHTKIVNAANFFAYSNHQVAPIIPFSAQRYANIFAM